jgi:hypothetical protein
MTRWWSGFFAGDCRRPAESAAMSPKVDIQPAPLRSSKYFSAAGPINGPIFRLDAWTTVLEVVDAPTSGRIIGIAYASGCVQYGDARVMTYRLAVNKTELPGRWVCIGRRFIPLSEMAEEL